jgi:dihydroneopterin aldolase
MTIHIESLKIDAIIGLLDFEREYEQRVTVDIEADYAYDGQFFVDYAELAEMVELRIKKKRFLLLEEALLDLKTEIVEIYPAISRLKLKISKPDILKNCIVGLSQSWEFSPEEESGKK